MTSQITRVLLLLAMASPVIAAEPDEPWPSKDQLRGIEQAAYACSRENSAEACEGLRQLADPLMDHSRLPGLCKDPATWSDPSKDQQADEAPRRLPLSSRGSRRMRPVRCRAVDPCWARARQAQPRSRDWPWRAAAGRV